MAAAARKLRKSSFQGPPAGSHERSLKTIYQPSCSETEGLKGAFLEEDGVSTAQVIQERPESPPRCSNGFHSTSVVIRRSQAPMAIMSQFSGSIS